MQLILKIKIIFFNKEDKIIFMISLFVDKCVTANINIRTDLTNLVRLQKRAQNESFYCYGD